MKKSKYITRTAIITALAVVLGFLENMVPASSGVPGVKLGFSNMAVLIALYLYGTKNAVTVTVLKVVLSSLLFSGFTGFLYSICGGMLSIAAETAAKKTRLFSVGGVSCVGGIFHNLGQLVCAYFIIGRGAVYYAVPLCFSGAVAGIFTGICTAIILKRGQKLFVKE